jgi:hypothetical protein
MHVPLMQPDSKGLVTPSTCISLPQCQTRVWELKGGVLRNCQAQLGASILLHHPSASRPSHLTRTLLMPLAVLVVIVSKGYRLLTSWAYMHGGNGGLSLEGPGADFTQHNFCLNGHIV